MLMLNEYVQILMSFNGNVTTNLATTSKVHTATMYILHIVNFIVLHLAVGSDRWLSCIVATCKFVNAKTAVAASTHPSQEPRVYGSHKEILWQAIRNEDDIQMQHMVAEL
uniref:Uncharacterized protein n=1 Tax=Glossina pallidipes TaxID=7398 RepID=A0A1B0A019_GLOPL